MTRARTWMLAAALALAAGLGAEHGEEGPGMIPSGLERPEAILKQLDLSQEQKDKLKALRRARRDKGQARRNALEDARANLHELLHKADRSKAHEDKIRAAHEQVLKLEQEARRDHMESVLEIRSILTDAQLQKFVELQKQRMEHRKHMREARKAKRKGSPESKPLPGAGAEEDTREND